MLDRARLMREIARRRTFAIISHPDAGKTTLTEKLLLYGGVIQLAGAVKAKRGRANAVSDWMEMERERGISITTSVLQFPYRDLQMNLLDTPGHADFSEDTYRTLHAVDGAVMLLDSAKGVESQTRKLFRVCKQRSIPIFTFVNKMDRPGRDPFELVGEVESTLGIGVFPITWPVYRSGVFRGVVHRLDKHVTLFDEQYALSSAKLGAEAPPATVIPLSDREALKKALGDEGAERLVEELELLDAAGDDFDRPRFLEGELSPMFFGSAINNFGLEDFLDTFCEMQPGPAARETDSGVIEATSDEFSAFVFKIQANMNKAHRDRVAFVRICSGYYTRGMKVLHVRTNRELRLANPTNFMAQERSLVEEAFAGDVIGIFDPGLFEIGDTLTGGARFIYEGIPSFAPEHFVRLLASDPLRRKQLQSGLEQLAQEGTIQLYRPPHGGLGDVILGAVGPLQIEVVAHRLQNEYNAKIRLEPVAGKLARWVYRADNKPVELETLRKIRYGNLVEDVRGRPVVLFEGQWALDGAKKALPELHFAETAVGVVVRDAAR
jgi:peptide chain release factor 3